METANEGIVLDLACGGQANAHAEVQCLRNHTAEDVVAAMPYSWFTQGVFGLPPGPQGMDYPGLPVVDGVVLKESFLDAFGSGVIDVPLMLGNVAEEPDLWPAAKVGQFSLSEWQLFLDKTFEDFDGDVGNQLYEAFYGDVAREGGDAQRAYDALVSDIGLTCPNIKVAQAAAATKGEMQRRKTHRKSSTYLFVNTMTPSVPIGPIGNYPNSDVPYYGRYAFHGWDLTVGMKSYPFEPSQAELDASRRLMDTWLAFMEDPEHGLEALGWWPADKTRDWPNAWNTMVQSTASFELVANYKRDTCALLDEVGVGGPEFWWAN